MTDTININDKSIPIKASADVMIIYKAQFGTDYAADCLALESESDSTDGYVVTAFQLLWSMAKAADPEILPPTQWAVSLGKFDLEKPLKQAQALYTECLGRYEAEDLDNSGEPVTAEKLRAYAALAGLTSADLNAMPLPMVLKIITTYIKTKYGDKSPKEATQEDFDKF